MKIEAPWAKLPMHLVQDESITMSDVRVYAYIDYAAGKRGYWYGSQDKIAEALRVSLSSVGRAVARLKQRGYLATNRLGIEQRTVLRYIIPARTIDAPERYGKDAASDAAPMPHADAAPMPYAMEIPQTQPQTHTSSSARAKLRDRYWRAFGQESAEMILDEFEGIAATHPPECITWVLSEVAAMPNPSWRLARFKFNDCAAEKHGPRTRPNQQGGTSGRANGRAPAKRPTGWRR